MDMQKLRLVILAVVLAGASNASASVTLTFVNVSPYGIVNLQVKAAGANVISFPFSGGVYAGIYNQVLSVNGGPPVSTPSFCIDVSREITFGETFTDYSYTSLNLAPLAPAGPMGTVAAADVEKLWAAYYTPSTANALDAAALQVAIWKVVAQQVGTYTVTVSDYPGYSGVTAESNIMLANLPNLTAEANLVGLVSPNGQNYVVVPPPNLTLVPEPPTMIAGVLLLLPFGASTLRLLRKSANGVTVA